MSDTFATRVLHAEKITHNISRFDLMDEIGKIRPVRQVFVLRPSSQALIEMYSISDAIAVKQYFSTKNLSIFGHEIDLHFSRHSELNKPEDRASPRCVLLVSIICYDNSTLPLRNFFSVCSQYGAVARIRMFIHNAGPQALVEYSQLSSSMKAKDKLEQAIFVLNRRRYSFEVQFSKLHELVISRMSNYSRDFILYPMKTGNVRLYYVPTPIETNSDSSCSSTACEIHESHLPCKMKQYAPSPAYPPTRKQSYDLIRNQATQPSLSYDGYIRSYNPVSPQRTMNSTSSVPVVTHFFESDRSNLYMPALPEKSENSQEGFFVRKYVFDGFMHCLPFPYLIDFFYEIKILKARFEADINSFSLILIGNSERSDAELIRYLSAHPIDGQFIRLREASLLFMVRK